MRARTKLAAIGTTVLVLMTVGAPAAQALSPQQTSAYGVVTLLGNNNAGSITNFWIRSFQSWGRSFNTPRIYFYGGSYGHQNTPCGSTTQYPNNGFYCSTSHSIHLDYNYMQYLVNNLGDYGNGGFLAHEFGHAIQALLGYANQGYRSEYHADCLAGLFTRWGYASGRLTGNDYWEAYYWLYNQPSSQSHGTASGRTSWFRYGYNQYSLAACNQALTNSSGRASSGNDDHDADDPIVERPDGTGWRLTAEDRARLDRAIGRGAEHGFDANPEKELPSLR